MVNGVPTAPVRVGGNVKTNLGHGDNSLGCASFEIRGNWNYTGGNGRDSVIVDGPLTVWGAATITSGGGNDVLGFAVLTVGSRFRIDAGAGDDWLGIGDGGGRVGRFDGPVTINLGIGNDTLELPDTGADRLTTFNSTALIDGGTGANMRIVAGVKFHAVPPVWKGFA
jgi:hypothetical protein